MRADDKFRYAYIGRVRDAAAGGLTSNSDIGRLCGGVSGATVMGWRNKYAKFDAACATALDSLIMECGNRMLQFSREGSESATRYILDRLAPAFKPKQDLNVNADRNTLKELLAEHMSDESAREQGLIIDAEYQPIDDEEILLDYGEYEYYGEDDEDE